MQTDPDPRSNPVEESEYDGPIVTHAKTHIMVDCPLCDRKERFDNKQMAQAWLTGHILDTHREELPDI